ncbi:MAG: glycosyltransferase [Coprobacillus cateniformis]|nr:glycosyltransferase, group 2 family protein [Candidatus Stoquefichus sp. KLE1796]MBS5369638.1 glycosyltransferase [Coprobacillus cateniformis]
MIVNEYTTMDRKESKVGMDICVLMSSYNGEKYINEQIDSIFLQDSVDVWLLIRDDGSTDNTVSIIKNRKEYGNRIFLIEGNNVGSTISFYEIMRYAKSYEKKFEYYSFADQDDVWLRNKLYKGISVLERFSSDSPNLYYSNLKVVDEKLNYLYDRFTPGYVTNTKKQIMAEICTLGCTCVFNRMALLEMCKLNNDELEYHDNWILWICSFLGKCYYDEQGYILYRQHGNNTSGTVKKGFGYLRYQIGRLMKINDMKPCYEVKAKLMLKYYSDRLIQEDKEVLYLLANYSKSYHLKMKLFFTNKISSGHIIRDLSRKIRILVNKA